MTSLPFDPDVDALPRFLVLGLAAGSAFSATFGVALLDRLDLCIFATSPRHRDLSTLASLDFAWREKNNFPLAPSNFSEIEGVRASKNNSLGDRGGRALADAKAR